MSKLVEKALGSLGKGFDANCDFRLKHCKGKEEEGRLVSLSLETADLVVPTFGVFPGVSVDLKCDKGERLRYQSDVINFREMSLLMNKNSGLEGSIPSGLFNSAFGFLSPSRIQNASTTRRLAMDGYSISLFHLRINRRPLALLDHVAKAIPGTWDPAAIARFIEKYGTHVIVGLSIGGQDVVFVRQDRSSKLPSSELKQHLQNLGDQIFTGTCTIPPLHNRNMDFSKYKKVPEAFHVFGSQPITGDGSTKMSSKHGITVIWSKKGGEASAHSHGEWLPTISSAPDAINFTFLPITSLLSTDTLGRGFLSIAIDLYLRHKPPLSELERFLDFQSQKVWAPMHHDLPLGLYANPSSPSKSSLRFSMLSRKLFVSTNQVIVGSAPVTGMRLHLEGRRNNRLAIHLLHLSTIPTFLSRHLHPTPPQWHEATNDGRFYKPIQSKKFSHVCTAAVEHDDCSPAFIVTGAQLHVGKNDNIGNRKCLRLHLLYSALSDHYIERSVWDKGTSTSSGASRGLSGILSNLRSTMTKNFDMEKDGMEMPEVVADSGVFEVKPPVPVREERMLRFVDTRQVSRGVADSPGHWLVTGARLALEKGRVALHVKFSLLSPSF